MSAINFPSTPTFGDIFTVGNRSWRWDGTAWTAITILEIVDGGAP